MNLKKLTGLRGIALAIVSGTFILTSCSKEVNGDTAALRTTNDASLTAAETSGLVSDTAVVRFFKGTFGTRGSRTVFRGAVSDTTAVISLDYFIEKKLSRGSEQRLLFDYADGGLSEKGWQYEVIIDAKTGAIKLVPNSIMESQIVPGSFKTIVATFDRFSSTFNFLTEVKEAKTNLVHQVNEIVTRQ